jgi:hypothetical protein
MASSHRTLGEVRIAVEDALGYFGPVRRESRNRFQSARIPTNSVEALGREFTLVTVSIDGSYPHKLYIQSVVYTEGTGGAQFKKHDGRHVALEKQILEDVHRRLRAADEESSPSSTRGVPP